MLAKYMRYVVRNYMFAVLALIFTITYWISAADLPKRATDFPRALLIILIPLFIWNVFDSIKGFKKSLADAGETWECSLNITTAKVMVVIFTAIYIAAMPVIGFVVSTVCYLGGMAFYLGLRKLVPLATFTVVYIAVLYGIFVLWLGVRLPNGLLF
jgi:hypothetical protein